jgi:hypothetical protein
MNASFAGIEAMPSERGWAAVDLPDPRREPDQDRAVVARPDRRGVRV